MRAKQSSDELERRRVPCLVTYISPFRIVDNSMTAPWSVTIEEVNSKTWDYVALHELVGGIEVGLAEPYHMAVSRDGALALPPLPELTSDQQSVEFFQSLPRCAIARRYLLRSNFARWFGYGLNNRLEVYSRPFGRQRRFEPLSSTD